MSDRRSADRRKNDEARRRTDLPPRFDASATRRILQILTSQFERPELLARVAREMTTVLSASEAVILAIVNDTTFVEYRHAGGRADETRTYDRTMLRLEHTIADARASGLYTAIEEMRFGDTIVGALMLRSDAISSFSAAAGDYLQSCGVALAIALHHAQMLETNAYLENLATIDALTGLPNRRAFDTTIDALWRTAIDDGGVMSVLAIDIDFFKLYNDSQGHLRGDEVLRRVAQTVRMALANDGYLARYGGEELMVILTGNQPVAAIGERLRSAVEGLAIDHSASPIGHLTISIGCATLAGTHTISPWRLVQGADESLAVAKRKGRNRVITIDPDGRTSGDIQVTESFGNQRFARKRINDALREATECDVTFVVAPGGCGKSSAVSDFLLAERQVSATWDVREEVGDAFACASFLGSALGPSMPSIASGLAAAIEQSIDAPSPELALAYWFAPRLAEAHITVVIDNVHFLGAPSVTAFLRRLVEDTLGRTKWIFIGRHSAGLPVASWQAYGTADTTIDESVLRFRRDEIHEYIESSVFSAHEIERLSNGWCAIMDPRIWQQRRIRARISAEIAKYGFNDLTARERDFLFHACSFSVLDLNVMRYDYDDVDAVFASIRRRLPFIEAESMTVYRLAEPLRMFLLDQVRALGASTADGIRRRAEYALSRAGRWISASVTIAGDDPFGDIDPAD